MNNISTNIPQNTGTFGISDHFLRYLHGRYLLSRVSTQIPPQPAHFLHPLLPDFRRLYLLFHLLFRLYLLIYSPKFPNMTIYLLFHLPVYLREVRYLLNPPAKSLIPIIYLLFPIQETLLWIHYPLNQIRGFLRFLFLPVTSISLLKSQVLILYLLFHPPISPGLQNSELPIEDLYLLFPPKMDPIEDLDLLFYLKINPSTDQDLLFHLKRHPMSRIKPLSCLKISPLSKLRLPYLLFNPPPDLTLPFPFYPQSTTTFSYLIERLRDQARQG